MRHRFLLATALTLLASAPVTGGIYSPGAYNSGRDPSTIVRIHTGVGAVRFRQPLSRVRISAFGSARGSRIISPSGGALRWLVRDFGPIALVAQQRNPRPIVAFILRGRAYRTPRGFGVGDSMRQTRLAFGAGRQFVAHGKSLPVYQFRRAGTRILVRFDARTPGRARVVAWAIVRDPKLSLVSEILRRT